MRTRACWRTRWASFFVPQLVCSENCLFRKRRAAPSHENSNNPLAVEPETENDAGRWNFYSDNILLRLKRRLPATTKGFIQMINTLRRATKLAPWLSVAAILATAVPAVCASAEPGAARRHQIAVPLRLHGALLQRAAGRRGLAAMPAEEHVEPVVELPERRARGRSAGGGDCQAGRHRRAESRSAGHGSTGGCCRSAGQVRRAKGRSRPRLRDSRPARRLRPSAARAAPIIQKSARACRPAARRHCNAWKRTRQSSRPAARKPFPPPAAAPRPRLHPRQAQRRQQRQLPHRRRPAVIVLRPMRPREELFVMRSACGADVRTICGGVAPGGGRIMQCLATNAAQLSPACKDVLSQFAAR